MPRMAESDMDQHKMPSGNFVFSSVKVDRLGATQYTLATIVVDESGTVSGFQDDLAACVWAAVEACKKSAQAENILLRVTMFNSSHREIHGFVPLANLQKSDYAGIIKPNGATALHEAICRAVKATGDFAKSLTAQDYDVNAAMFFLTDGLNNCSPDRPKSVRDAIKTAMQEESIGTITTVLVGINDKENVVHNGASTTIRAVLEELQTEAGLTQYVGLADATPSTLAKLGAFISRSISSSSQAITSGGAKSVPPPVTF